MIADEVKTNGIKYRSIYMVGGAILISLGLLSPLFLESIWFSIIIKMREAISIRDSGHLILASAIINSMYTIQNTFIFMGTMLVVFYSRLRDAMKRLDLLIVSLNIIIILHWTDSLIFELPWEPVSTLLALLITLFLFEKLFGETNSFIQVFIVSIQVFFAFHWLNIMPFFTSYRFGQSDIYHSIKATGIYLDAAAVLNFTGFAFFLPFIVSSFITATLFISYSHNIRMVRENYNKENEIRDMRAKALENRIYQEVKSLVHDLKTPLVTIRGLNSLLVLPGRSDKLEEYSERIEDSVSKMSEMISSFLYETSRQKLKVEELISYIRAQLPLEDESIKFEITIENDLPYIYINKIRIARALINVLENAIVAPCFHPYKVIKMQVKSYGENVCITIQDNGTGIKETDIPRIWDTGFSTNNTSGLGLPFAKRIIENNKGSINISSEVNIGTIVTVLIPTADKD